MAFTVPLAGLIDAFQLLVTVCPEARVNESDHPLTAAVPVLVMVMFCVSPVFHALTMSETAHVPETPEAEGLGEADALAEAEAEGDGEADADAELDGELLGVGVGVGVPPLPSRPKK